MRERLNESLKAAMKAGDKRRVSTIRMVTSAIKDKDIASRTSSGPLADGEIVELLAKLIKSRDESARLYDEGGRPELAAAEREEIAIIREFLPAQLSDDQVSEAIRAIVAEIGASGMRDMGRVMAVLKERYTGKIDVAKASGMVKSILG